MIYIVSGYRRSGTTAMMNALRHGGMASMVSPNFLQISTGAEGYMPLPTGCLEVGKNLIRDPEWLRHMVQLDLDEPFCMKVFFDDILALPVHEYEVVFMRRRAAEIQKSCETVDHYKQLTGIALPAEFRTPFDHYAPYSPDDMQHVIDICSHRDDMLVTEIWYHTLVEDPKTTLMNLGWPVDIDKAAEAILPEWYRSKI